MKRIDKIGWALVFVLAVTGIVLASLALMGSTTPHKPSGAVSEPTTIHRKVAVVNMPPATTTTTAPVNVTPSVTPTTTLSVVAPVKAAPTVGATPTTVTPTTVSHPAPVTPVTVAPAPTAPPTTAQIPVTISASDSYTTNGTLTDPETGQTCQASAATAAACVLVTVNVSGISPVPAGSLTLVMSSQGEGLSQNQSAVLRYTTTRSGQTHFLVQVNSTFVSSGFTYAVSFAHAGYAPASSGPAQQG